MTYTCPMHPEVEQDRPGRCPHCGMKLIKKGSQAMAKHAHHGHDAHEAHEAEHSYQPLIIITALITAVTIAYAVRTWLVGDFNLSAVMSVFMAGYFLVFSGFKLLDLEGFAGGYSTYDLLAKRVFGYGYLYPFLELGLGILYALQITSPLLNLFTFALMTFSGIGVALKLVKHEKFQCACLGTFLKVPLTKVTLVENFGMALMALVMLAN